MYGNPRAGIEWVPKWNGGAGIEARAASMMRPSSARPEALVNRYLSQSPRRGGVPIDPATWMRLHNAPTAVRRVKQMPHHGARVPASHQFLMSQYAQMAQFSPRGTMLSPRRVPQALLSPRSQRPMSAVGGNRWVVDRWAPKERVQRIPIRPSPWASTIPKAKREEPKKEEVQEEVEEEVVEEVVEEVKRKRGELPPGVTRDDIRKCASRIKEKLLDKFGTLHKAFKAIDEDRSGFITRDELDYYLIVINIVEKAEVVDALFETIDADESGSFDFQEFTRVMSSGDIFAMAEIKTKVDAYAEAQKKREAEELAVLTAKAKAAGMTVEEYKAYWASIPGIAWNETTSADQALKLK